MKVITKVERSENSMWKWCVYYVGKEPSLVLESVWRYRVFASAEAAAKRFRALLRADDEAEPVLINRASRDRAPEVRDKADAREGFTGL